MLLVVATALATSAAAQGAGLVNLSVDRPTTASSEAAPRLGTGMANDGLASTRWLSDGHRTQWWEVDLAKVRRINTVMINWGAPVGRHLIRTSIDGEDYTTVATVRRAPRGKRTIGFAARKARYVRIRAVAAPRAPAIAIREVRVTRTPRPSRSRTPPSAAPRTVPVRVTTPSSTQGVGFGVASGGGNLQYLSATDQARHLDAMKSAGSAWVRFDMAWSDVQSGGRTSYAWDRYDRLIDAIQARGMKPLGVIAYTPAWARPANCGSDKCGPASLDDFGNFAAAVAARYASRGARFWELWNEPNIQFWLPAPDPARYAALLKVAYPKIKAANPLAVVITAGLSPHGAYGQEGGGNMNPVTYIERMYAAGAKGSFDAIGFHPYNFPAPPTSTNPGSAWNQMQGTSVSVRSLMTANGDGAKEIWATEFGYPSCSSSGDGCVSEAQQAALLKQSFDLWKTYPWAGPLFWYDLVDAGSADSAYNRFGLVRQDMLGKPALASFSAAVR